MDLKEKVKSLPSCPGVYLMKDSLDNVIYVGKSKNLKNRVGSYFINSKNHSPKVLKLVKNLKNFEYIITDTEFEAFLLECKLIQEIKPAYNKLMKSPMSYSYIKLDLHEKYPSIDITNNFSEDDGNLYWGPYSKKNTVERGLDGIKQCCKILCNNNSKKASSCINYSLGLCIGMCLDTSSKEEYMYIIDKIIKLLNRKDTSIIKDLEAQMSIYSERFDFENAAKYRDYISAIKYLNARDKVIKFTKKNKNIVLLEYLDHDNFKIFLIKGHKVLFKEKYSLKDFDLDYLKNILIDNIILYFNNDNIDSLTDIGRDEIDESEIIYTYLKSKSNNCKHIIISDKFLNTLDDNINVINELFNQST